MEIDFQRLRFDFPSVQGNQQFVFHIADFPSKVIKAEATINSFNIGFTQGDHHLLRALVNSTVLHIENNAVTVGVLFALRDSSGNFDDPYDGYVTLLLIVDRE